MAASARAAGYPAAAAPDTAAPAGVPVKLRQVVFWGICDVKYDPRVPLKQRVKVLELGDGRSSRFSHHGKHIKEKFDKEYCMDPSPLKRAVMVDNKKFTHDMFVRAGFENLRPVQYCYPRRYEADLAARIARDLEAPEDGAVVLKLVNRSRGAGVVVCPVAELDTTLRRLLTPPVGPELDSWLRDHATKDALRDDPEAELLEEQARHYWANECPLFVVEELCHSQPVDWPDSPGGDDKFDGTMRVAFALLRAQDGKSLSIDWLGGYWKLPPVAARDGDSGSLEDVHCRIVSSFNTEEKRTAEVPTEHLKEVFDALSPALPAIFAAGTLGVAMIKSSYPDDPHFRAFALSRAAAAMRATDDISKVAFLMDQAKKMVKPKGTNNAEDLPERSVLSYIDRSMGVNAALQGKWSKAIAHFNDAIKQLPTNSSAHYLKGMCLQEEGRYAEAVPCHLNSVALDPDFRSPCIALGSCWCSLGQYQDAVDASQACLHRQPDAPVAQFNMGQAIYQMLHEGFKGPPAEAAKIGKTALEALQIAKSGTPQQWGEAEEAMLRYFLTGTSARKMLSRVPVKVWKNYGWRP